MGEVFFGIPETLARALIHALDLRGAVETGTHLGDSAAKLREWVDEVWTVELSSEYVGRARQRHPDLENVHFLQGSSEQVLRVLAPTLERPVLYWLDAHWCEDDTAGADAQCPLLEEIAAIDQSPSAQASVILIDDARFFLGCPWPTYRREDWPTFMQVADTLRSRHQRYVTTLQDVIVAGPPAARAVIESYWQGSVFKRLMGDREWLHQEKERLLQDVANAGATRAALEQRASSLERTIQREWSPPPALAMRRLAKSLLPPQLWERARRLARRWC